MVKSQIIIVKQRITRKESTRLRIAKHSKKRLKMEDFGELSIWATIFVLRPNLKGISPIFFELIPFRFNHKIV